MNSMTYFRLCVWLVFAGLALRVVAMAAFPLFDTTEARYGEMARLMLETGNWVTPLFDYNTPFWGKPPLQTWSSAIGVALFGVHEFALRLPHFLAGMAVVWLCYRFARSLPVLKNRASGAVLALCTIPGFLLCIGMVMTDTLLTLSVTLSVLCGWWVLHHPAATCRTLAGIGVFAGMGLGMLAKGPVAIVLIGLSLGSYLLLSRQIWAFVKALPWIGGLFVMAMICLPWYLMAEQATPGFIEYFIVGEHWLRFTVPGWEGDLYGNAHEKAKGTIWLFLALGSLPWLPWLAWQARRWQTLSADSRHLMLFLMCWFVSPGILFTFAGNILPAYVLPGIPAVALMVPLFMKDENQVQTLLLALATPVLMASILYAGLSGKISQSADKGLLDGLTDAPVYYVDKRPFSGQFYSAGQAKVVERGAELNDVIISGSYIVVARDSESLQQINLSNCKLRNQNRHRLVYYCHGNEM